jgi:thioesterase domain-containing protein
VILFKAVRGLNADQPSNGWDKVKLGELVVHPLDCYHGSILFEPAVSQFAAILQQYIIENIRVENELGISEM